MRSRCSIARSPGDFASRSGAMVLQYGVVSDCGTYSPSRRAAVDDGD